HLRGDAAVGAGQVLYGGLVARVGIGLRARTRQPGAGDDAPAGTQPRGAVEGIGEDHHRRTALRWTRIGWSRIRWSRIRWSRIRWSRIRWSRIWRTGIGRTRVWRTGIGRTCVRRTRVWRTGIG